MHMLVFKWNSGDMLLTLRLSGLRLKTMNLKKNIYFLLNVFLKYSQFTYKIINDPGECSAIDYMYFLSHRVWWQCFYMYITQWIPSSSSWWSWIDFRPSQEGSQPCILLGMSASDFMFLTLAYEIVPFAAVETWTTKLIKLNVFRCP